MARSGEKRLFKVDTNSYGAFFRYATNAVAAKSRVVFDIFGRGYEGWEHDYWTVTEASPRAKEIHPLTFSQQTFEFKD